MDQIALSVVVAIIVALAVVGALMIPFCYLIPNRKTRVLADVGATLFAVAAVVLGDAVFTRWALYTGGHGDPPGIGEWLGFAALNAILAGVAGILGGALGMGIATMVERRSSAEVN